MISTEDVIGVKGVYVVCELGIKYCQAAAKRYAQRLLLWRYEQSYNY